ncbi:hypothetical protein PC41400_09020 [Paenibacillus chitinolyticus]|uniref:Uncharacterized protein n=1 Tax=Paenibacillus chitinolyticus TaxID=79263 RepID=A0A410WTT5_9BACL|nr:hypothetical protein [Paenibacillus chitinolyticus]MCY9591354.1 hypothetical protein [Paenibacillus chitinolyticus]MCY9597415.1 hypothetical protein [Paenibacillus chitinolyticus]QAV17795.1 hypothetical protein PC41400_09020 [Paenibacillus chitinolyticus]
MGRNKKIALVLVSFVAFVLFSLVYYVSEGSPIQRYKFKKELDSYIQEKFSQNIMTENIKYSFKNDIYWILAHPENNKELSFEISQSWNDRGLWDDFLTASWRFEVNQELESFVKSVYAQKGTARINLGNARSAVDKYSTIPYGGVPSYQDIKQELKDSIIYIHIDRAFKKESTEDEYDKVYKVIQFIKAKGYKFEQISFSYKGEQKDSPTGKTFEFNSLDNVNSQDDIVKFELLSREN